MLLNTLANAAVFEVITLAGGCFVLLLLANIWRLHGLGHLQSTLLYPFLHIKKRAKAWSFLWNGPNMIQEGYDKANGASYEIFTPEKRWVFVTSEKEVAEINNAGDDVLSLQAAAKQLLQPKVTMHNFDWFSQRGVDGTPLVKTTRVLLTNNLPELLPEIRMAVSVKFDQMLESHKTVNGAKQSPLYWMLLQSVSYSNALAFFGPELARSESFMKSAVGFIEHTLLMAELIRPLPPAIGLRVGKLLAKFFTSGEEVYNALIPIAEERVQQRDMQRLGHKVPVYKDCLQWVMETSPKKNPWSAERIVHELMALWFGSVHIISTSVCFVIHDLCLHPEYVEPLRREAGNEEAYKEFEKTGRGLPLLDSFIKESMRLTPTESMSARREALKPFTLSSGERIEVGEWICTPLRAINKDPALWSQADEFHGFRFVDQAYLKSVESSNFQAISKPSELTDVTYDWQLWGIGRIACPGRFYASSIMKTLVVLFLTKYDLDLVDPNARRWLNYRSFIYPLPWTKVALRPRDTADV